MRGNLQGHNRNSTHHRSPPPHAPCSVLHAHGTVSANGDAGAEIAHVATSVRTTEAAATRPLRRRGPGAKCAAAAQVEPPESICWGTPLSRRGNHWRLHVIPKLARGRPSESSYLRWSMIPRRGAGTAGGRERGQI